MECNNDGFLQPVVDENKCVNCSLCDKCCVAGKRAGKNHVKDFYAARALDESILNTSSSGGLFSSLAGYIIESGGVVYGAAFDGKFNVVHKRAETLEEASCMKGSKYVQSDLGNTFNEIRKDLNGNKPVLFSGTPCQVMALKTFLNVKKANIENLYLIDLICHGVCSPYVWRSYLSFTEEKFGKIESVNMRYKNGEYGYCMRICGDDYEYIKAGGKDPYVKLFQKNLNLRSSCFACKYKSINRVSDITIGDFQNLIKKLPDFYDSRGTSTVIINTYKGRELFEQIKDKVDYIKTDEEKVLQPNLKSDILSDKQQKIFFNNYKKMSFIRLLKRYTELGIKNRIITDIRRQISSIVKR